MKIHSNLLSGIHFMYCISKTKAFEAKMFIQHTKILVHGTTQKHGSWKDSIASLGKFIPILKLN